MHFSLLTALRGLLRGKRWVAALLCGALVIVLCAVAAVWQISSALRRSGQEALGASHIKHTVARLDLRAASLFEPLGAPAVFSDAKLFNSHLYLCGPAGLYAYDSEGKPAGRFNAGAELPPAPLVRMATGLAADAVEPELYIATAGEGLLAFNGRGFRQIRAEERAFRTLTAVLPLPTGRVLLGTESKGVLAYDGRQLAPFHSSLNGMHVTVLAGDDSSLWVGTLDRGVLHWIAGRLETPEGLPDPRVLSLAVQGSTTWVGTPAGVAEFRDGRFARVLAEGVFSRALLPRGSTLAIGTEDEGVVELPLSADPRPRASRAARTLMGPLSASALGAGGTPASRGGTPAVQTLFEVQGQFYALAADGLYTARDAMLGWRPALGREPAVLTDRNISALAADRAGRLWVGYFDRGLDVIEAGGARVTHVENEHVFCVNRIVHDAGRGVTAVATANGLVFFDAAGAQRQVLGSREGLIADHVTDVLLDGGNTVLATPAGITFLGPGGASSLYAFHGLVNNHVYALAAFGDRLLAGTLGGLSVLERGAVRASYTTANSGLKHNWITAIVAVDGGPSGVEWFIGTYGGGVVRFDAAGRWEAFPDAAGFEVNPNAMLVTPEHVLAGTLGNGLYVFDRAHGRWRSITAGLPSANVTALAPAGRGFIYIGTDNGLVRIAEQRL